MRRVCVLHRVAAAMVFCLAAVAPCHSQSAVTFNGGGVIDSEASPLPVWGSGRTYLTDRLDAYVQLRHRLTRLSMRYRASGYFEFTSEQEYQGDLTELNAVLELSGFPGEHGNFSARLGRLPLDEPSGFVFRQPGDGIALSAALPGFEARLSVAYLGLLLKNTNEAIMTAADTAALSDNSVVLAPNRGVASLTLFAPEVLRNDLWLWGMYFSGLGVSLPTGRWYAGFSARGPIWGALSQRLDLVAGAALAAPLSVFSRLSLWADLPGLAGSLINAEVLYASGNSATTSAFLPLTGDTAGVLFATPLENLVRISLGYSLHPFGSKGPEWFSAVVPFAASRWYLRVEPGAAPLVGFVPAGGFYGTELEAGLSLRHGDDPSLSVSGGLFVQPGNPVDWFGRTSLIVRL